MSATNKQTLARSADQVNGAPLEDGFLASSASAMIPLTDSLTQSRRSQRHVRNIAVHDNMRSGPEQTTNEDKPVALDSRDPRTLRLYDLGPEDAIVVTCLCGWITEYGEGMLQRQHRVPSDTLLFDLQYRLRCRNCGAGSADDRDKLASP